VTWFVYLIECRDGSIYTGIAVDVAARYAAHASGKGARYTRSRPPLRLLASFKCVDRSSAARAEYRIKQLTAVQKRGLQRRRRLPTALLRAADPPGPKPARPARKRNTA
jgi:putative endonuclease